MRAADRIFITAPNNEVDTVMGAGARSTVESVVHSNSEHGDHRRGGIMDCHPTNFTRLDRRPRHPCNWSATVDQRHNAFRQILVDASECTDFDVHPGLFEDFTPDTLLKGFVELKDSAGRFPLAVVGASDDQHPTSSVEDDSGHAHQVPRQRHGLTRA